MLKPPLYALDGSDGSVDFSSVLEQVMLMACFPPVAGQVGENGDRERAGGER